MKQIKKFLTSTALMIFGAILIVACNNDDYLTDGGVHSAETKLTAYDYLAQNKYQLFDTLIMLIDHYELKEDVNNAGTFFAPTDYSIANLLRAKLDSVHAINENYTYTLNDLYTDISADSVRQYLLAEKVSLGAATTSGEEYTTLGNTTITVKKVLQTDAIYYTWSKEPVYFLYFLKYPEKQLSNNESCQTTGILTQSGSGTILHALSNNHGFVNFRD